MKRTIAITALWTLSGLLLAAGTSVASDGFPPKNLPDGSGWLPGPNATMAMPGLSFSGHREPNCIPAPMGVSRHGRAAAIGWERPRSSFLPPGRLATPNPYTDLPRAAGGGDVCRQDLRPRPYANSIQLP